MEKKEHKISKDEIDEMFILYQKLTEEVSKHSTPSNETLMRFEKNDLEHREIKDSLNELKKMMQEDRDSMKPILDNFMATRKLGKWLIAFCSFLALLFGIIISWSKVYNIFRQ